MNWKFDRDIICLNNVKNGFIPRVMIIVFYMLACGDNDQHKQLSFENTTQLDSLDITGNQSVNKESLNVSPEEKSVVPVIAATGVITYDPGLLRVISARYSGRIEKLYVRYNYQAIKHGQRILDIYSPEILTAQQNLLFLLDNEAKDKALIDIARQRLTLLGLADKQLEQIITTRQIINPLPVFSSYSGLIYDMGLGGSMVPPNLENSEMGSATKKDFFSENSKTVETVPSTNTAEISIKEGMYIQMGQNILSVYNVNRVWAVLNIFPQDASFVRVGDKVSFFSETYPHRVISSEISYIEPAVSENNYTIKARVYLNNSNSSVLKIGSFISAKIQTRKIDGIWIPRTAVINLGRKQIVFLKVDEAYITKIVRTGYATNQIIQIIAGLNKSDIIAANAQSMVDSESFIKTGNSENE